MYPGVRRRRIIMQPDRVPCYSDSEEEGKASMGSMPQPHARGYSGEQSMGFFLGERGYFFIDGPSGAGGHSTTASGFDGVAFNPQTHNLIIYDNKAYARSGNVSGATAIDPSKNLGKNLDDMIGIVQVLNDLPNRAEILNLLQQTRTAVQNGTGWPGNVDVAVSNASGQSSGVGSRLTAAGIKFIDYYNAPRPTPPPSSGGNDTEAQVGAPRDDIPGAGRLPGMSAGPIDIAGAHMILRNGLTQISLQNAGNEAYQAYIDKKPEIERIRKDNPGYGVRLDFYFQYSPGVNLDFPDTYRFEELTVTSNGSGFQGIVTDTLPRGELQCFTAFLPALDPSAKPVAPATPAAPTESWYQRYLMVRKAYDTGTPPYTEAFEVLNGSNMYDILRVLDKLVDDQLFNLFQNLLPGVPGIGTDRLAAAFGAIRASWGGAKAFDFYTSQYGKEFNALFPDQQKDIREFVQLKTARRSLIGKWRVQVQNWTWIYQFTDGRYVRWTDPFNNQTGLGVWSVTPDRILLSWAPQSKTTEQWDLPVDPQNETGKCCMSDGTYNLKAVRI